VIDRTLESAPGENERAALLARVRRRYRIITEPLNIGTLQLSFTRIADPNIVLDQVAREVDQRQKITGRRDPDPQHLPYWAELWDSAAGLGEYLVGNSGCGIAAAQGDFHVLDLGCGMGLSGTVAAALGAKVLLADMEAPALLLARLNSLPWADRASVRRLDWRVDRLAERFDLILGADILYERKQWEFLSDFWRVHLKKWGRVLLAEPGRQTGDLFIDWVVARQWKLEQFAQPIAARSRPIRIFRLCG
jgi:predicted nicotinamide N-methyase